MSRLLKLTFTSLGFALGVFSIPSTAQAAYIEGNFVNPAGNAGTIGNGLGYYASTVQITYTDANSSAYNQSGTFYSGHYEWQRTGGTSIPTPLSNLFVQATSDRYWTFCLELNQGISNPVAYNVKNLTNAPDPGNSVGHMNANQAAAMRQLWYRYHNSVMAAGSGGGTLLAAFQLALWEIVWDSKTIWGSEGEYLGSSGADLFTTGNLVSSSVAARNQANTWLKSLTTQAADPTNWGLANLAALVSVEPNGDQDQVIELKPGMVPGDDGSVEPVPAPPALLLALAGLAPCVAVRRRLLGTRAA